MALTKAQVSLVTVAALGVAPGGYLAELQAFNSQKEAAAFIATTGLLNAGTNAEFVNSVAKNLGASSVLTTDKSKFDFLKALNDGVSRADALVEFANTQLVQQNGSIANVNKAIASTSTSMDLNALKAELNDATTNGLRVEFTAEHDDQDDFSVGTTSQTIYNIGKAQIDAVAGKISKDFTFALKNQIGENATFTGNFLSPILDQAPEKNSGSTIVVELSNLRQPKGSDTPLKDLPTNGFGFTLNGELVSVVSKGIYDANTYAELEEAVRARVEELGRGENLPDGADADLYAKLVNFEVTLGAAKPAEEIGTNGEIVVTHDREVQPIILKDMSDKAATLVPAGWSYEANPAVGGGGYTLFGQMTDAEGQSTQFKIETNLEANNVGYGSQGATVNLVGQSASDKGIEQLNVNTTNNAWFTKLQSQKNANTTNHLEIVNVNGDGYFRVGTQKNDPNIHLAALVDEDFAKAGLVDVQQLNAGSLAGSVAVNSYITDAVIKRFDLEDTDADHLKDNKDALINYNLTTGNDVLQIKIDSEVVAYADAVVNINAGAGNDFVHLQINEGHAYGSSWLVNQQENDNINITATSGNNTIWTEGAGNANITTGSGADTILADNSGKQDLTYTATAGNNDSAMEKLAAMGATVVKATGNFGTGLENGDTIGLNGLFVLNAASTELSDIVSHSDYATGGTAATKDQVFNTYKNTVQVSFLGFESKHIEIAYDKTKYTTNMQQINQAVKKAINEDATLSKLIVAKEFPGNVLVIESLIDGARTAADLDITFVNPQNSAFAGTLAAGELKTTTAEETAVNALIADTNVPYTAADLATLLNGTADYYDATSAATAFVTADGATKEIVGDDSGAESDNVINAGAGNDVIVLGTGTESNDTVVLSGNFGKTTIVNFDSSAAPATGNGADLLDFSSYFVNTKTAGVSETITLSDKRGSAGAVLDDEVTILKFTDLEGGTASGIDNTKTGFSNVTAAQLKVELAAASVTGDSGAVSEHVFLIENDSTFGTANAGEYLVVTATTTVANGDLTNVSIVGTLDFGVALAATVAVADFA